MYAFLAGVIFNFGNMLLLAAISVAGMATAIPMAYGVALVIVAVRMYFSTSDVPAAFIIGACGLILVSIAVTAVAYSRLKTWKHETAARAGTARSTRRPSITKEIVLSVASGLVLGLFSPLLIRAQDTDFGLGPYATAVFFGVAILFSTVIFSLFLMNLPVDGEPLEVFEYFRGSIGRHAMGLLAGVLFGCGLVAALVGTTSRNDIHLGPPAVGLSILAVPWPVRCGLLAWREYRGSGLRTLVLAVFGLILLAAGIVAIAVAPALPHA